MSNFTKSMSYLTLNGSTSISGMIKKSIKEYEEIEIEKISGQMIDMESTPLNRAALKLIQGKSGNHQIKMLTAGGEKCISLVLPFATYRSGGKIITNAYVDNICRVTGDKVVGTSDALFSMLGSAFVANSVYEDYGDLTNRDLMIPLMNIYVDMMIGVFNVMVHARADKKLSDILTYGSRRFFLENMLNITDSDSVANIAIKGLNNIDQGEYEKTRLSYDELDIPNGNLEQWLNWVKKISSKTSGISKKLFIEKWIRQYGEYSYFAMDNIEYLIGSILMTMAFITGYSRTLQALIKASKTISKLHSALYTYSG